MIVVCTVVFRCRKNSTSTDGDDGDAVYAFSIEQWTQAVVKGKEKEVKLRERRKNLVG